MDTLIKTLKNCIARKQGKNKINLAQAARKIGIPHTTLFQILMEERDPRWSNLKNIMKYAGCAIPGEENKAGRCVKCMEAREVN